MIRHVKEEMTMRCAWVEGKDPLYVAYHDEEWGVPNFDDQQLFEMLCLEGAQAGLSWWTVLKKRAHYREVFDRFDAHKMKDYDEEKIASLLADPGIIRNKLKVNAFIRNAEAYLKIQAEHGSFSNYIWSFVDGTPINNEIASLSEVPAKTEISDIMSKQLKKDGFKFIGSTICYAFMQAVGMVNDHVKGCQCSQVK